MNEEETAAIVRWQEGIRRRRAERAAQAAVPFDPRRVWDFSNPEIRAAWDEVLQDDPTITVGTRVRRKRGKRAVGTVVRIWTAPAHTKEVYCPNPKSYRDGYKRIPERRMARVAWPARYIGGGDTHHSDIQVNALERVDEG
jgi:hypothetical protein